MAIRWKKFLHCPMTTVLELLNNFKMCTCANEPYVEDALRVFYITDLRFVSRYAVFL